MLNGVITIGLDKTQAVYLKKRIILSNIIALIGIPTAFTYFLFYFFYFPPVIPHISIAILLLALVPLLNSIHWNLLSRLLLCMVIIVLVSVLHGFAVQKGNPPSTSFMLFNFTLTFAPWLVIDLKERALLFLTVSFNFFIILNQQWFIDFFETDYSNELFSRAFFVTFLIISAVSLSNVLMYVLNNRIHIFEQENLQLVQNLQLNNQLLDQQKSNLSLKIDELNKEKEENGQKTWLSDRLNRVTQILQNIDNQQNTLNKVLSEMSRTLEAGMSIIYQYQSEPEKKLDLVAAFAPSAFQLEQVTFLPGEGLVGQCAIEMKTKVLEISQIEDYEISSGLGETKPNGLIFVPAISQDKLQAVIEVAFINPLKAIQIEYLEVVGKIIGNWIYNQNINKQTQELLKNSQQQAELLARQEEDLRRNFEELKLTQEEMQRRENEYREIIESLRLELAKQN
jgi:hypothetical protein